MLRMKRPWNKNPRTSVRLISPSNIAHMPIALLKNTVMKVYRKVFDNYFSSNTSEISLHVPTIGRWQVLVIPSISLDKSAIESIYL